MAATPEADSNEIERKIRALAYTPKISFNRQRGRRLREVRLEKGIKQVELGQAAHESTEAGVRLLQLAERGRSVRPYNVTKFAKVLNLDPTALFEPCDWPGMLPEAVRCLCEELYGHRRIESWEDWNVIRRNGDQGLALVLAVCVGAEAELGLAKDWIEEANISDDAVALWHIFPAFARVAARSFQANGRAFDLDAAIDQMRKEVMFYQERLESRGEAARELLIHILLSLALKPCQRKEETATSDGNLNWDDVVVRTYAGVTVRRCRIWKGWEREDLAKRAGVRYRTIQRLEDGEKVNAKTYARIFHALDVPAGAFAAPDKSAEYTVLLARGAHRLLRCLSVNRISSWQQWEKLLLADPDSHRRFHARRLERVLYAIGELRFTSAMKRLADVLGEQVAGALTMVAYANSFLGNARANGASDDLAWKTLRDSVEYWVRRWDGALDLNTDTFCYAACLGTLPEYDHEMD